MKPIKLYPPKGGTPVTPHPAKVEEMKSKGWKVKPAKSKPSEVK